MWHNCGIILDCQAVIDGKPDSECFIVTERPCTFSTATNDGKFLAVGSGYSYISSDYGDISFSTIDPKRVFETAGREGITETMPGTMLQDIRQLAMPYGIYVNPYTGYYYATDASDYASSGRLLQWDNHGQYIGSWGVYINPGHILALPPDGMHFGGVDDIVADTPAPADNTIYNLQGIPVTNPAPGQVYIMNGRKFIKQN